MSVLIRLASGVPRTVALQGSGNPTANLID